MFSRDFMFYYDYFPLLKLLVKKQTNKSKVNPKKQNLPKRVFLNIIPIDRFFINLLFFRFVNCHFF